MNDEVCHRRGGVGPKLLCNDCGHILFTSLDVNDNEFCPNCGSRDVERPKPSIKITPWNQTDTNKVHRKIEEVRRRGFHRCLGLCHCPEMDDLSSVVCDKFNDGDLDDVTGHDLDDSLPELIPLNETQMRELQMELGIGRKRICFRYEGKTITIPDVSIDRLPAKYIKVKTS